MELYVLFVLIKDDFITKLILNKIELKKQGKTIQNDFKVFPEV